MVGVTAHKESRPAREERGVMVASREIYYVLFCATG